MGEIQTQRDGARGGMPPRPKSGIVKESRFGQEDAKERGSNPPIESCPPHFGQKRECLKKKKLVPGKGCTKNPFLGVLPRKVPLTSREGTFIEKKVGKTMEVDANVQGLRDVLWSLFEKGRTRCMADERCRPPV